MNIKSDKIRVLRIINRFNLGGPTYNAAYLTKYLPENFETLLIGGNKYEQEESSEFILTQLGIKPIVIPEMQRDINRKNDTIAYKKIKQIIKDFNPHIVHTHASKAGTLGRLAAKKMKVPVIVHTFHGHVFHSYFGKPKTLFYKNIERFLAKKTNAIIAISNIQKKELAEEHKICNSAKIKVVPLGFDLSRFQENINEKRALFRKKYKLQNEDIAIGITGRLVPIKNHKLFFDVAKIVIEKSKKNVRFFVIGDGEEKQNLKDYCRSLNLSFTEWDEKQVLSNIIFTSWIKNIDWANAGLDIITLTSLNEGTPVSLIEAQASNKPIVTTNVGGVKNVTLENKTAYITEVTETNKFADFLLKLIENDNLRISMGSNGWDFVKHKFSYQRLVNDTVNLYQTLLTHKRV